MLTKEEKKFLLGNGFNSLDIEFINADLGVNRIPRLEIAIEELEAIYLREFDGENLNPYYDERLAKTAISKIKEFIELKKAKNIKGRPKENVYIEAKMAVYSLMHMNSELV